MNILYLCDEYPPGRHGGIGSVVRLLAKEMVKKGHNVVVAGFYNWSYGGANYFEDEGVKVYRFRRRMASSLLKQMDALPVRAIYRLFRISGIWQTDIEKSLKKYRLFLEELIRKYAIDIVEMPDFNDYIQYCKRYVPFPNLSVPVVVKIHGGLTYIYEENQMKVPSYVQQMEADILKQADAVCSVSKYTAHKTSECLGYTDDVKVLYNGLEMPDVGQAVTRERNRVIFTGTLTENKGIYQLMDAWNIVIGRNPDARLHVLGRGPVGKVKANLKYNVKETVVFHGHVTRQVLLNELAASYVAVFPSVAESFGMAPAEAMACGAAVIFTKRTCGPELIAENVNGLLTDPYNPEEIAEKICYLLDNPETCRRLAEAGRKHIAAHYSISHIADNNLKFYQNVLSAKKVNQKEG